MKNVILATLGMGLLVMGSINTASALPNIPMGGVLSTSCTVPNTPVVASAAGGLADNGAGGVALAPAADGSVAAGDAHIGYASSYCNAASNVTLTTTNGAILTGAAAPAGFTNEVTYTAGFDFGGCFAAITTLAASGSAAAGNSALTPCPNTEAATFTVNISSDSTGTDKLVAGTYADILVVSVVPQ